MASFSITIPARFASTRLPGKPLALIHGKPMIQWVVENAKRARGCERVVVLTDDARVEEAVKSFKGDVIMTSPDLKSGTDRMAAVLDQISSSILVNVQGDEPMMPPEAMEAVVDLIREGRFQLTTAATPLETHAELMEPSVVKVIQDSKGKAIYFSRFPIPYSREAAPQKDFICKRHLGIYAFSRELLKKWTTFSQTELERAESLEQLRALHNGIEIGVVEGNWKSIGVDTPQDLETVRNLLKSN